MLETQNLEVTNTETINNEPVTAIKKVESDSWSKRKDELTKLKENIGSGFQTAAPRFAAPAGPTKRSAAETITATLRQGLTGNILEFFNSVEDETVNPDYDVTQDMRPQDYQYGAVYAGSQSSEKTADLQRQQDQREADLQAIKARPWVSGFATFLDPVSLGVDFATYGLAHGVTVPLLANSIARTQRGAAALNAARQFPKAARGVEEATKGLQAGATSIYTQEKTKGLINPFETEENLGANVFIGGLIGMALGGSVGFLGRNKSQAITDKFREGNHVSQSSAQAPDFMGPPRPTDAEMGILSTGKRPDIRAQGPKEEVLPARTAEEVKTESESLKYSATTGGEAQRRLGYETLRTQFSIIGENFVKNLNLPAPIKKAIGLVAAPWRNMSAVNRQLSRPFGSARLFAIGMARNAVEFLGTRQGLVLPRSAQNRIEDITNHAVDMGLDLHRIYMKANGIEPGKPFAAEQLTVAKRAYEQKQFFEEVATQLLYVGKSNEKTRGANPYVQEAASKLYNEFYKPYGEILRDYGIIKADADIAKELNYLNRLWKNSEILASPEEFKDWLANIFNENNQQLKTLRPQYDKALNDARQLKMLSNRYAKAADTIDKLKNEIEAEKGFAGKIEALNREKEEFVQATSEKYEAQRDEVRTKYEKLRQQPPTRTPDVAGAKKSLREEITKALNERDGLSKTYSDQRAKLRSELKDIRSELKQEKEAILSGSRDRKIRENVKKADIERLMANPENHNATLEEITAFVEDAVDSLDEATMRQLRKDLVAEERFKIIQKADEIKLSLLALENEKKAVIGINRAYIRTNVHQAQDLLEREATLAGQLSKEQKIAKLINDKEQLELKTVDLKEGRDLALKEQKIVQEIAKIQEPVNRLEYMQKQYSREGFIAYAQRRGTEKAAKGAIERGMDPKAMQKLINEAKATERKRIAELPVVDEARVLSDEFAEGYDLQLKQAEEIIPWELRSSETGRPYRIYDEAENPEFARHQAERTFYTLIGQDDELVMNPVLSALSGGKPGLLKKRDIKVADNYPGIERWVERDARFVMNNFASGIAPVIALTELMHELNKLPIVQQTVKRMQVLNPAIGATKALMLPSVMKNFNEIPKVFATMMREEYRFMSEGLSGKPLEKLTREYQAAEKDLATIDQQIKGVFGNGVNVNSKDMADFVDLFNSAASTVTTNNIAISMMGDMASPAIRYGFSRYINKALLPLLSSKELRQMSVKELKKLRLSLKVAQGAIIKDRISGREASLKNSNIGRRISNVATRIGNYTGANKMQDMLELSAAVLIKTELLEMAERAAAGKLTAKETTHLAQRGLTPKQAANIHELAQRYGWKKAQTRGIDPTNLENPSPKDAAAYADYQRFVNDDLRTLIVRPGVGSMPNYAYSPAGKAVLYLKKYFFAATNDLLVPALQRGDKEAVQGFMGLFAVGALQSRIRALYRADTDKEFNMEGFIFEALTNSGLPGLYTFGIDAGLAAGILSGMGGARYDPSNGLPSLLLGPGVIGYSDRVLNILGKMRKIMTDEDRQFTYQDWNYMANTAVPLYKWAPISSVVKPNVKEYFEQQGRG